MRNPEFIGSQKYQQQRWRAERFGANAKILAFERAMCTEMRKLKVPMFAHCVMRSDDEQTKLFVQGHSKAKAGQSPHNHGYAVDIVHSIHAWNLDRLSWSVIGHVGKEVAKRHSIDIEWGGDWSFYDPAHWQIRNWRKVRDTPPDPESKPMGGLF